MPSQQILEAKESATEELLQYEGVRSVGVREVCGEEHISVGVISDQYKDSVPDEIGGFPVYTFVADERFTSSEPEPIQGNDYMVRPVKPGLSMTHIDKSACTSNYIFYDPDTQDLYLGSNAHCFADFNRASIGDTIVQPSPIDYYEDNDDDHVGTLAGTAPLGDSTADFAWADIDGEIDYECYEVGDYSGPPREPELGDDVLMQGRSSGTVTGEVTEVSTTMGMADPREGNSIIYVNDVIRTDTSTRGGDSGSPLFYDDGDTLYPMGVTFAGGEGSSLHCKVSNCEAESGLKVFAMGPNLISIEECRYEPERPVAGDDGIVEAVFKFVNDSPLDLRFDSYANFRGQEYDRVEGTTMDSGDERWFWHEVPIPDDPGMYDVEIVVENVEEI